MRQDAESQQTTTQQNVRAQHIGSAAQTTLPLNSMPPSIIWRMRRAISAPVSPPSYVAFLLFIIGVNRGGIALLCALYEFEDE